MHRRRFAVLLGAGASYGAWDDPSSTPPLGDCLLDRLVAHFPNTWGSLDDEQRSFFVGQDSRPAFERGMLSLWEGESSWAGAGPPPITVQALLTDLGLYFAAFQLPVGVPNCYSAPHRSLRAIRARRTATWRSDAQLRVLDRACASGSRRPIRSQPNPSEKGTLFALEATRSLQPIG